MKVRNMVQGGVVLTVSLGLASLGTGMGLTSSEITPTAQQNNVGASAIHPEFVYTNTHIFQDTFQGYHSGDWTQCGFATAQSGVSDQGCQYGTTVSAEVTGSSNYGDLSSLLGFNISYSQYYSYNYSAVIPAGEWGVVARGFEYAQYYVISGQRTCEANTGVCGSWTYSHNTVQDVISPTGDFFPYRYTI